MISLGALTRTSVKILCSRFGIELFGLHAYGEGHSYVCKGTPGGTGLSLVFEPAIRGEDGPLADVPEDARHRAYAAQITVQASFLDREDVSALTKITNTC